MSVLEQSSKSFFVFLNKPVGPTSQQCLTKFKRTFGFKKVGHFGTLDPFASGLLLVGVNEATKYFQFIEDKEKTYEATLCLGAATDTLDSTGEVVEEKPVPEISRQFLEGVVKKFIGKIKQTPPMYSAVKKDGKRLYVLAREGKVVSREPREVEIHSIKILSFEKSFLKFEATVSRGTYIRVLAEDLAMALGTVGHLTALIRTGLCGHDLSVSATLEEGASGLKKALPIQSLLKQYEQIDLSQEEARLLFQGKKVTLSNLEKIDAKIIRERLKPGINILGLYNDNFIGILSCADEDIQPLRLMNPEGLSL